ncbi:MAG: hypothetical protein L3J35_09135 [Bacteroidales bacterium]|nr:hypothetical protein [Bacteroidales bacterium]
MKKKLFLITTLLITGVLFTLNSCKKDDADSQSAEDAARGSYIMADAFALGNSGTGGGKAIKEQFYACSFNYTVITNNGFELTWIDCTDDYGITRNGTIRVTGDETVYDANTTSASLTIEFINYSIEGQSVSGKLTFTVSSGLLGFYIGIAAENFKIVYADGTSVIYNSADITYVFSILNGFKIEIVGGADGVNRKGQHFSYEIEGMKVEFLATSGMCTYPTEGTITINIDGEKPIVLDYNTETCGQIKVSQKRHKDTYITIF